MGFSFSKSCLTISSTMEWGTEASTDLKEEGTVARWVLRVSERREEREEGERVTSRWSEWDIERWWDGWKEKGVMTWNWSEEIADVRNEESWDLAEEEKLLPTSLTVMGTETCRLRREEGMGGWCMEGWERCFLREEGRERNESFVAVGSTRDCWLRKESSPRIGAAVVAVTKSWRRRRRRTPVTPVIGGISEFGNPGG